MENKQNVPLTKIYHDRNGNLILITGSSPFPSESPS